MVQEWKPASCPCVLYTENIENGRSTHNVSILKYYDVESNPKNLKFNMPVKEVKCNLHKNLNGQALINSATQHEHDFDFALGIIEANDPDKITKENTIAENLRTEKQRIRNLPIV